MTITRTTLSTDPRGLAAVDTLGRAAHVHPYQVTCGLNVYLHVWLDQDPGAGPTYYSDSISGYQITGGSRADLSALREALATQVDTLRAISHPQAGRDAAVLAGIDTLLLTSTCPAGANPDGPCYAAPHASVCTCTHPDA